MKIAERAQTFVAALECREITVREVAECLQCNESYLSRVLSGALKRIKSSTKLRKEQAKLAGARRQMRQKHASLVLNGHQTLKKAAANARCSERTIRRYMEKLNGTDTASVE